MRSVVALAAAAALALLCPTASAQEYSYPEYERAEKFTAPCGWKHTGSSTADVSDWARKKPWFTAVKAHMNEYIWLEHREPCPAQEGQIAGVESCTPKINDGLDAALCSGADLSGDAQASESACKAMGQVGSPTQCANEYPCCEYFDPAAGCAYSYLEDPAWIEAATNREWEAITPEGHPGNYLLAVAYYAVWLIVQAILSLFGALLSCCCLRKKKLDEEEEPPSFPVMWAARGILGLLLVGTLIMANTMELLGNRALNDSMHNALHSVEGLTDYANDALRVVHALYDVGDNVYEQMEVVNQTIFGNANPSELQAAATCMQEIGAICDQEDVSNDDMMGTYYEWAGDGEGPEATDPAQMTTGKCDTATYTVGQDYVLGSTVAATENVILDEVPDGLGQCIIFCLVGLPECTGAQWSIEDDSGGGQTETNCVLWKGGACSMGSASTGYQPGTAQAYTQGAGQPVDVVYKRKATVVPADQIECVQDKTVAILAAINDNVLELPTEITGITDVMSTMMANGVPLCLLPVATPLGDALDGLVPTLQGLQDTLSDLMATVKDAIRTGRASLDTADDSYEHLIAPPPPGDWGYSIQEDGSDYPQQEAAPTPAQCNGGAICLLNADETACLLGSSPAECWYQPAQSSGVMEDHVCVSLTCLDNQLNYIDENRDKSMPMARTKLFSAVSMAAMGGSVLGLLGLVTNKTILWKLMCFLFFFWGPASLILSGVAHPPMIGASDLCQDVEQVVIDVTLAQNPLWDVPATAITLLEGEDIENMVRDIPNFNYTGEPIEDIVVTDMRSLMGFYFTDDCQGPGGGTIASTLETLENIMIEVVVVMAGNMGDMIGEMAGSMGDSGMTLNPALVVQITEITDIVAEQVPPVISDGFAVIGCARISEAYYQIKSPICCDVVVSMYWVAYPLSVMGFCTLTAMILTIVLSDKAFPGTVPENPKKKGPADDTENPVYDK